MLMKRIYVNCIACILLPTLLLIFQSSNGQVKNNGGKLSIALTYLRKGKQLAELENYKAAIIEFDMSISQMPSSQAYFARGDAKYSLGEYEGAILDFDTTLNLNSNHADAFLLRAYAKMYLSRYETALLDCDKLISIDPKNSLAFLARGITRQYQAWENGNLDSSKLELAIIDFNKSIFLNSSSDYVFYRRSIAYRDIGWYKEALIDCNRAIEIKPSRINYQQRAYIFDDLQQYEAAISNYTRALEFDQKNYHLLMRRGISKKNIERYNAAVLDFNMGIEISPEESEGYRLRGETYLLLGKNIEACRDFRTAKKLGDITADWWLNWYCK